ncbi:MAG TPA: glycosyltransferase family 4 protein [Acetivibrio sp.]|nr:glycosyltransferase family 4 protein [Acetivibrio sp.]
MKIIYVTTEFVTEKRYGGLGSYLEKITDIFASRDHQVIVTVLSKRNESFMYKKNIRVERVKLSEFVKAVLKLITFGSGVLYKYLFWKYQSYILNRRVAEICKKDTIDIIQYASLQGTAYYRISDIPAVVRISSYAPLWRLAGRREFDFDKAVNDLKLMDYLELKAAEKADLVFGPSRLLAEVFQDKIGRPVEVIESPVSPNLGEIDDSIYQSKLAGKKYLLYFGTLNALKGLLTIADSIEDVLSKYPDLYFVLIGRASRSRCTNGVNMADYILNKAGAHANRVIHIPFIQKPQLFAIIRHSIACVLPSRVDNLPNTCIEAMSLGKVVIGTERASFEQLITDGVNGFLSVVDSPESLKSCIDKVMSMEEAELIKMGEAARARVEKMAPEIIYQQVYELYQRTIRDFKSKLDG